MDNWDEFNKKDYRIPSQTIDNNPNQKQDRTHLHQ